MSIRNIELENQIYDFIKDYSEEKNINPSVQEIADHFGCAKSTAYKFLVRLEKEGRLQKSDKGDYYIQKNNIPFIQVPLVGVIACGTPIFAEQNIEEYIPLPRDFLGKGEYFALRAKGDSMINAGIDSGDIVFIRIQNTAENGEIIVALTDEEATLKRYYKRNGKIILHPENESYKDIIVDKCLIQGIAIKVLKKL